MMKESILIRNAGPLRDVGIDSIKPLTFLIGMSGSGKSVFMKSLIMMRYIYKMLNIRAALKNAGVKSPFRLSLDRLLQDDLAEYYGAGKSGEIFYSIDDGKYSISIKNGKLNTKNAENIEPADLHFMKESWVTEMRSAIPMWMSRQAALRETGFYFRETAIDFDKAVDAENGLQMPHIGMTLQIKNLNGKRRIYLTPDSGDYKEIELKNASSGMQSSTPVVVLADYFSTKFSFKDAIKRSVIDYLYEQDRLTQFRPDIEFSDLPRIVQMHIEEPELSLYPTAQCMMVEDLISKIHTAGSDRQVQMIMATHSPYIVNYLNVLMNLPDGNPAALQSKILDVYMVSDGKLRNLMAQNSTGKWIVDSSAFSEPMLMMRDRYHELSSIK